MSQRLIQYVKPDAFTSSFKRDIQKFTALPYNHLTLVACVLNQVMAQSVADLLTASLSPDDSVRQAATHQLEQLASSSYSDYVQALVDQLAGEGGVPSHVRNAAGLAIKNTLSAREGSTKDLYAQRWTSLDGSVREKVKAGAMSALSSADRGARNVTGQVIAAIASIELPAGLWSDLISQLLSFVGRADNAGLRQATLQTIGYICESIVSCRSAELMEQAVRS